MQWIYVRYNHASASRELVCLCSALIAACCSSVRLTGNMHVVTSSSYARTSQEVRQGSTNRHGSKVHEAHSVGPFVSELANVILNVVAVSILIEPTLLRGF